MKWLRPSIGCFQRVQEGVKTLIVRTSEFFSSSKAYIVGYDNLIVSKATASTVCSLLLILCFTEFISSSKGDKCLTAVSRSVAGVRILSCLQNCSRYVSGRRPGDRYPKAAFRDHTKYPTSTYTEDAAETSKSMPYFQTNRNVEVTILPPERLGQFALSKV